MGTRLTRINLDRRVGRCRVDCADPGRGTCLASSRRSGEGQRRPTGCGNRHSVVVHRRRSSRQGPLGPQRVASWAAARDPRHRYRSDRGRDLGIDPGTVRRRFRQRVVESPRSLGRCDHRSRRGSRGAGGARGRRHRNRRAAGRRRGAWSRHIHPLATLGSHCGHGSCGDRRRSRIVRYCPCYTIVDRVVRCRWVRRRRAGSTDLGHAPIVEGAEVRGDDDRARPAGGSGCFGDRARRAVDHQLGGDCHPPSSRGGPLDGDLAVDRPIAGAKRSARQSREVCGIASRPPARVRFRRTDRGCCRRWFCRSFLDHQLHACHPLGRSSAGPRCPQPRASVQTPACCPIRPGGLHGAFERGRRRGLCRRVERNRRDAAGYCPRHPSGPDPRTVGCDVELHPPRSVASLEPRRSWHSASARARGRDSLP